MILVLSDEERKAYQKKYHKKYNSDPKVKARIKKNNARPEFKAHQKEYNKKYRSTPEHKAKEKARQSTPEHKAKEKARRSTPENKAKEKEYNARPENVAKRKAHYAKPEVLAKLKSNRNSERLEVLQYYSKRLSKSNIPCCRCCGENFHIDFLAVDHIAGMKEMDSEPELVKLGYSSSMGGNQLTHWIIENNFPKGFQILCHNCNMGKGMKKNNNKCPHEK